MKCPTDRQKLLVDQPALNMWITAHRDTNVGSLNDRELVLESQRLWSEIRTRSGINMRQVWLVSLIRASHRNVDVLKRMSQP